MTPWIPEHDLPVPEVPEAVAALHVLVAAMHTKCIHSMRFMRAVEREAAKMTVKQSEQLA